MAIGQGGSGGGGGISEITSALRGLTVTNPNGPTVDVNTYGFYIAINDLPDGVGDGDDAPFGMLPGIWMRVEDAGATFTFYFLAEVEGTVYLIANDAGVNLGALIWDQVGGSTNSNVMEMTGAGRMKPAGDYNGEVRANVLQFARGQWAHTTVDDSNTPYDIVPEQYYAYLGDTTVGNITINLPATPNSGEFHYFKKLGLLNTMTIDGNGNDVEDAGTLVLTTNKSAVGLLFDGTEWYIVSSHLL